MNRKLSVVIGSIVGACLLWIASSGVVASRAEAAPTSACTSWLVG